MLRGMLRANGDNHVFPVRLYVSDTDGDRALFDTWYDLMPQSRQARADRFKNEPDRRRCILAYALLVTAVREVHNDIHLSIGPSIESLITGSSLDISETADGKPYLTNIPICFNISHSKERVAVAVSAADVGCDVECKSSDPLRIAKRFFTAGEYSYLLGIEDKAELASEFTRLWTLKESIVKCCGEGIRRPFSDFSLLDDEGKRVDVINLPGITGDYHIREYEAENGYCYSICSTYDVIEDEIRWVRLT